jgi:glyoxalase-like protein
MATLPRLRQAVVASRDLDRTAAELRQALGLGEPYADPGVEFFGLRNAVFALADSFLEVVSPIRSGTAAGRLLDRRGDDIGYMLMFQVEDLGAARERARSVGVREVFELALDDIAEVHLHPADMRGGIVSLSEPSPPGSWRWGGPDWQSTAVPLRIIGASVTVAEPGRVAELWQTVLGAELGQLGIDLQASEVDRGLTEVVLAAEGGAGVDEPIMVGGVRFVPARA